MTLPIAIEYVTLPIATEYVTLAITAEYVTLPTWQVSMFAYVSMCLCTSADVCVILFLCFFVFKVILKIFTCACYKPEMCL